MFEVEAAALERYNSLWPNCSPYILMRLSRHHKTVHAGQADRRATYCGQTVHPDFTAPPEEGNHLCFRCAKFLERISR